MSVPPDKKGKPDSKACHCQGLSSIEQDGSPNLWQIL